MGMEPKEVITPTIYSKEFLEAIDLIFTSKKEEEALSYLSKFKNMKAIATLSGKDSTVSTYMFLQLVPNATVLINRYVGHRKMPNHIVEELYSIAKMIGAKNIVVSELQWDAHSSLFFQIAKNYDCEVIITGLRKQEDGEWPDIIRIGDRYVTIAAPLRRWRHSDVWAYIWKHRLPVPSQYRDALPWESLQSLVLR